MIIPFFQRHYLFLYFLATRVIVTTLALMGLYYIDINVRFETLEKFHSFLKISLIYIIPEILLSFFVPYFRWMGPVKKAIRSLKKKQKVGDTLLQRAGNQALEIPGKQVRFDLITGLVLVLIPLSIHMYSSGMTSYSILHMYIGGLIAISLDLVYSYLILTTILVKPLDLLFENGFRPHKNKPYQRRLFSRLFLPTLVTSLSIVAVLGTLAYSRDFGTAAQLFDVKSRILIVVFVAIVFTGSISFLLSSSISSMVDSIRRTVLQVNKRDFTVRVNDVQRDEIGLLANSLNGMIGWLDDLTSNLEAKVSARTDELKDANEKLKALDQAKSAFFANISHELKTPLTLVLTPLESILASGTGGTSSIQIPRQTFQSIRQNAYRLSSLIGDLLELTRSELGSAKLHASDISNTEEYLRSVFSSLAFLMQRKEIGFDYKIPENLKPHYFDRQKIDKVIVNLIGNAAKFTQEGGKVSVEAEDIGDALKISISDTGIGIPEEQVPHVFDRFMQVDPSATRNYGGMGIGLSLVKEFIEQHGGQIDIESKINEGTKVSFTLPRGKENFRVPEAKGDDIAKDNFGLQPAQLAENQNLTEVDISLDKQRLEAAASGGGKIPLILIVDDTPEMADLVRSVLVGYRTEVACDGVEGLEKAKQLKPDLIISDVMMPRKDGYGLVRDLKAEPVLKEIPVILLTAKVGEESLVAGFAMGADDYILKPFQPKEVIARVENLLRLKRQKDELLTVNEKLKETQKELIHVEKSSAVGVLAAGMAHELNNPIAAIRTFIQALLEDLPEDDPSVSNLKAVERATGRCKRIVADVLTFSRQKEVIKESSVNDVVEKTVSVAKKEFKKKGLVFKTDLSASVPRIAVDAMQLQQVLMNLIHNGTDAIGKEGSLEVRTKNEGSSVLIEVLDAGSGISPELLTKVFDPFFTTKSTGKGMGLGLALCKNIIERHGGSIGVQSEAGKGSHFTIRLPKKQSQ